MADFLDEGFVENEENVDSFVVAPEQSITLAPQNAVKNRAATTALLSANPAEAVDYYKQMLMEAQQGPSPTQKALQQNIDASVNNSDTKAIMGILSDASVPFETKQKIIQNYQTTLGKKDNLTTLHSNFLVAPSEGESVDQEHARISTADAVNEVQAARINMQGLVNSYIAKQENRGVIAASFDALSSIVPFGSNLSNARVMEKAAKLRGEKFSIWDFTKAFFNKGGSVLELREQIRNMPPAQQMEYTKQLVDYISTNSSLLFGSDNQYQMFERFDEIWLQGYDSSDAALDTIFTLLDAIGLGDTGKTVRSIARGKKVATAPAPTTVAGETANVVPPEVQAQTAGGRAVPPPAGGLATQVTREFTQQATENVARLNKAIDERAKLLGDAGNVADKGVVANARSEIERISAQPLPDVKELMQDFQRSGMKAREAKAAAEKELAAQQASRQAQVERLQGTIDQNAIAENTRKRLDELDAEIAALQKSDLNAPGRQTPISQAVSGIFPKAIGTTDVMELIEKNYPVHVSNPASPGEIAHQANPTQARAIHDMVFKSEEDEVASAFYGVNRQQALVNNTFPQAGNSSGAVQTKASDINKNLRKPDIPEDLVDTIHDTGAIHFTPAEKASARANVMRDFTNARGMTMNPAMSTFTNVGGRIMAEAVYGSNDGAWSNARQAMDQAKYALAKYGVRDDEIEILRKEGLHHVPVSLEEAGELQGNFLIRVKTPYEFLPSDITALEKVTTKRNWLDRNPKLVSAKNGSVTRHLFDAASVIDPLIYRAASVASDAAARLRKQMLEKASDFSDIYAKLSDEGKVRLDGYIREANFRGIAFDEADVLARGFGNSEIAAAKAWRNFWDAHFYLENYDLVRTLRNQNYQVLDTGKDKFFARPVEKNINRNKVYDPNSDMVITLSKEAMDDLYDKGGTIAVLRRKAILDDQEVENIIVRNSPTEYLRGLRDTDRVLNYREGYYQIQYKAPRFVDEIRYGTNGEVLSRRAIAVAGDTKEAQAFADRMTAASTGYSKAIEGVHGYEVRENVRNISRDSDEYWDLNSASGRIAQRHRGKLLEDAGAPNQLGDGDYIVHPVDSAVQAAKSVSGRTTNRAMLETAKTRLMDQYPDAFPDNGKGGKMWPEDKTKVGDPRNPFSEDSAAARTNWEYIRSLEDGYINSIDDAIKAGFQALGRQMGEKGFTKIEKAALKASEVDPLHTTKRFTSFAYIGSNFLRQGFLQAQQGARMLGYNPVGIFSFNMVRLGADFLARSAGAPYKLHKDGVEFKAFVDEWGALQNVDQNNLVRGTLKDAAQESNRLVKGVGKVAQAVQAVGFDLGEQTNLLIHASAVFDKLKREGADLTDRAVRDEAFAKIRSLSGEFNAAGDMPYTQNSMSFALQFLQSPHKMLLQLTNRNLSYGERMGMAVFDLLAWGLPVSLVSQFTGDVLPDDQEKKDILQDGLLDALYNKSLTAITGEEVRIDFSGSLGPYNMDGWGKMFVYIASGGVWETIINSPTGQLFLKDGGRIQNALSTMGSFFRINQSADLPPATFVEVMNETAKIFSVWNNVEKARILATAEKQLDKYGNSVDRSVSHAEVWAQAFGFTTKDVRDYYASQKTGQDKIKARKDEIDSRVNDIFKYYKNQLQSENVDLQFTQAVIQQAMNAFNDPVDKNMALAAIGKKLRDEEQGLIATFLRAAGINDGKSMRDWIRNAPVSEEDRAMMNRVYTDAENARGLNEEE